MAKFWHWHTCHSMMQGSNENIKEIIGIISILDYLKLIQICVTQHSHLFELLNYFFIYLDEFSVFWIDELLMYSQIEEEH